MSIPSLQGQSLHCVKQIDMAFYNDMHHAIRTKSTLNMWRHLVKDHASQGYLGSFNKGRQLKTLNSEKYAWATLTNYKLSITSRKCYKPRGGVFVASKGCGLEQMGVSEFKNWCINKRWACPWCTEEVGGQVDCQSSGLGAWFVWHHRSMLSSVVASKTYPEPIGEEVQKTGRIIVTLDPSVRNMVRSQCSETSDLPLPNHRQFPFSNIN